MKNKHFNFGREVSHTVLLIITILFSAQLGWMLGNTLLMHVILVAVFVSLELEKWYASRKVKTEWKSKKRFSGFIWTAVLVVLVSLSAYASYAAMRISILSQSESVTVNVNKAELEGVTVESIEVEIEQIDISINELNTSTATINAEKVKMSGKDGLYITANENMEKILSENKIKKDELMEIRRELVAQKEALKKIDGVGTEVASDQIFGIMAQDFGLTTVFMLKVILITIIIILELSLFLVTDPLEEEATEVKKDEKEIFTEYITELFNNGGKKYLNSDNKVASKIGISVGQCKKYKEMLLGLRLRGNRALVVKEANGYTSAFPVSSVLKTALNSLFVEE